MSTKKQKVSVSSGTPHYYAAHALKTVGHDYTPKTRGDSTYCTVCGFDEALHILGSELPEGATFDDKSKTWTVPSAA